MLKRRQVYKSNLDRIKSELDDATKALQNIGKPSSSRQTSAMAVDKDYDWKYNNQSSINGSEKGLTRFTVDKEISARYPTSTPTTFHDSDRKYTNGNNSSSKLSTSNSSSYINYNTSESKLSMSNSSSSINDNNSASKLSSSNISSSNISSSNINGNISTSKLSMSNSSSSINGNTSTSKLCMSYNNSSERLIERPPVPSRWTSISREGVETPIAQKIVAEPSSRRQVDSSRPPPPPFSPSASTHTTFHPTKLTANQLNQVSQLLTREEKSSTLTTTTTSVKSTSSSRQPTLRPGTYVEQFTSIQQLLLLLLLLVFQVLMNKLSFCQRIESFRIFV